MSSGEQGEPGLGGLSTMGLGLKAKTFHSSTSHPAELKHNVFFRTWESLPGWHWITPLAGKRLQDPGFAA